jgi:probable HAF family extracellular repeat protein
MSTIDANEVSVLSFRLVEARSKRIRTHSTRGVTSIGRARIEALVSSAARHASRHGTPFLILPGPSHPQPWRRRRVSRVAEVAALLLAWEDVDMKIARLASLAGLLGSMVLCAMAGAQGVMVDLGAPSGTSFATGVNASGAVVVGWTDGAGYPRLAFRWTAGSGIQYLGTLPGGDWSVANAVSADGVVVVGEATDAAGFQAMRWTAMTGMQSLGTLSGNSSEALAVNADGSIIVGKSRTGSQTRAFRWSLAGGMQDLPVSSHAEATGVSADGAVVVGWFTAPLSQRRAFRWTSTAGAQSLGTFLGGTYSQAFGVSADGSVVVGHADNASGNARAFRWTAATGMQDIGSLPGAISAEALSVSLDGSAVVGRSGGRAFHWVPNSMFDLESFGGGGGGGSGAFAVNDDGSVVVGYALDSTSHARAVSWEAGTIGSRYCHSVTNSTGMGGFTNVTGSNVVAANNLQLGAANLPINSFGFFLTSRDRGSLYPVNNSQGRLCLGGFIGRYVGPGQIKNSGTAGAFTLPIDLTLMPQPFGGIPAQSGDTWNFQAWYRDANPQSTSNFTDAVSVNLL